MTIIIIIQVRCNIWRGELEWQQCSSPSDTKQTVTLKLQCTVSTSKNYRGEPAVGSINWPSKLRMQFIPNGLDNSLSSSSEYLDSWTVQFHPHECGSLLDLANVMGNDYVGLVYFPGVCDIKILVLLYSKDKEEYLGVIPKNQDGFVDRIHTAINRSKNLSNKWTKTSPPLVRPAWIPQFRPGFKSDKRHVTKFEGKPFIPDGFTWPICDSEEGCGDRMTFLGQINLATIPAQFQDAIKLNSGLLQMFLCTSCWMDEEVIIIKRSEFVPSLQLLAAEALVNHEKFEKFDLKRLGLLENYVRENMSHFAHRLDERGHVVDKWQLRKLERPLYQNKVEPLYEGLSDLEGFTDCVVEEVKRNYNISDDKFHIDVMPQLEGITEVPHRGWLIKLGGFIGWSDGMVLWLDGMDSMSGSPDCLDCGTKIHLPFLQMKMTKLFQNQKQEEEEEDVAVQIRLCPKCQKPIMELRLINDSNSLRWMNNDPNRLASVQITIPAQQGNPSYSQPRVFTVQVPAHALQTGGSQVNLQQVLTQAISQVRNIDNTNIITLQIYSCVF